MRNNSMFRAGALTVQSHGNDFGWLLYVPTFGRYLPVGLRTKQRGRK